MRNRFTVLELMTVVALLLVLTAISIPVYDQFKTRAKFVEVGLIHDHLYKLAEIAMPSLSAVGTDLVIRDHPQHSYNLLDKKADAWGSDGDVDKFNKVDYRPDGAVLCSHNFWYTHSLLSWKSRLECDLNDDEVIFFYTMEGNGAGSSMGANVRCEATGSYDPDTATDTPGYNVTNPTAKGYDEVLAHSAPCR